MTKKIFFILLILLLFAYPVYAGEEGTDLFEAEKYATYEFGVDSILEAVPYEVRGELPEGDIFEAQDFSEKFSLKYFLDFIGKTLRNALSPAFKALTSTLGLVLLSAVLSAFKGMAKSDSLSMVFELASGLCILVTLYKTVFSLVERVGGFLSQLTVLINAMVPVVFSITVAGGNSSAATVNASAMMLGVALIEGIAAVGLFPMLKLCFGMAVCSGIGIKLRLDGVSRLLRNVFTWVIGLLAAAISAMMTFQTSIASKADCLSMRAMKFAVSSAIPVAGGIASDGVSAVAGSVSLIKGTVGVGGVIILALMVLPIIVDILMLRFGVSISSVAADVIGLEREKRILDEICGLLGFLAAVCVISVLMFVYGFALFANGTTALGGG